MKWRWFLFLIVVFIVYAWAISSVDINLKRIVEGLPKGITILNRMFINSTNLLFSDFFFEMLFEMLRTLLIAYFGTFIASLLSVPFGFLSAVNFSKFSRFFKIILNFIRTFPEILLAIIFVSVVGPGPFAGALAIGIHSIGMLGKLYTEAIENIDKGIIEAVDSVGANFWQKFFFGIIPQVFVYFVNYSIYRFELAVRSATIVGMVGAGGIGTQLILKVQNRNWEQVGIIIIIVIITVALVDFISYQIRKRLV
ncbi:MAG: phosphonate ABC transporter, permease protein PhnE [candidate division WOR-3 bacterium]|nr:phosphonate ABC transporter, permease protein PhnE [candidate division WOR-3 bacterium]MCX7948177.1 phosphonate ABC transporter, permease protein PhnE [candidate division WOR-3 bacterium]MDW8151127.1 phosphonate ABC transporter, permease protein PhnE [candidate division WOR-3 bacterium]